MKKLYLLLLCFLLLGCHPIEEVAIQPDSDMATKAYYYDTGIEGKNIVIVGGIHGDEIAGWQATDLIRQSLKTYISSGKVLIIPHANQIAINEKRRYGEAYGDLNRTFLGDGDKTSVDLSQEISDRIREFEPDIILDLHESLNNYMNKRLGNTIILTDVKDNLLSGLEILDIINPQIVDDIPFIIETNPPIGSINRTLSEELEILVVTIETNRELKLEKRIEEQLIVATSIIEYISK
ncbi:MAG: succinylglutamate desuccinylase/aspartoacylase family protein [Clostridiales bacterium]|nr:succinylglutamate desuccinylase/aspartoacylase family protein [Clostridiales bacterium]